MKTRSTGAKGPENLANETTLKVKSSVVSTRIIESVEQMKTNTSIKTRRQPLKRKLQQQQQQQQQQSFTDDFEAKKKKTTTKSSFEKCSETILDVREKCPNLPESVDTCSKFTETFVESENELKSKRIMKATDSTVRQILRKQQLFEHDPDTKTTRNLLTATTETATTTGTGTTGTGTTINKTTVNDSLIKVETQQCPSKSTLIKDQTEVRPIEIERFRTPRRNSKSTTRPAQDFVDDSRQDEDQKSKKSKKKSDQGKILSKRLKSENDLLKSSNEKSKPFKNDPNVTLELNVNGEVREQVKLETKRNKSKNRVSHSTDNLSIDCLKDTNSKSNSLKKSARASGKKRQISSSSDEVDEHFTELKTKNNSKTKKKLTVRKIFTKPRKLQVKVKTEERTSVIRSSDFELNLLKLARHIDDPPGDLSDSGENNGENSGQDETKQIIPEAKLKSKASFTTSSGDLHKLQTFEANDEKKRIIMSMLEQHETVAELSDDSDDGDDSRNVEINESKSFKTTSVPIEVGETRVDQKNPPKASGDRNKNENKEKNKKKKKKKATKNAAVVDSDDSDDSDDWQIVADDAVIRDRNNYQRPENVTVILKNEDFLPETKRLNLEQRMIRLINRKRKISYQLYHRVHFVTLLAHQRFLNSILNDVEVKAYALSRLPPSVALTKVHQRDDQLVRQLLLFYKSAFRLEASEETFSPKLLKTNLITLLMTKSSSCNIVFMFGLLVLLRVSGVRCRLCLSYGLLALRAPQLRIKDGEIVELGSKTRTSSTNTGILDFFVEIYLSDIKRWRPLDIEDFSIIDDPQQLTPHLEQPVSHLVAIEQNGCMIDLSPKYNADWLNRKKALRPDADFVDETLAAYAPEQRDTAEEDLEVASRHDEHGLPKVISEFKKHPKYALRRHLLKFEAFYPADPPVLGYVRGEPVYPRDAVKTLRSKDTWHRQARQVRERELPYGIVKARPKWNKRSESFIKDLPLEVFGEWQTEPYKPPVAKDGVVPRNTFGNVELFHPDMLPLGTAHLKLPGLQRIADELGLDCVPAVVGFDGIGRGCHPVIEGFVVCEENRQILEDAWHERQREDRHKRIERIRKRAAKNWRKMIRKVIWELRLKKKYNNKLEFCD